MPANTHPDALAAAIAAELATYPLSAFEGDAENGPRTPLTRVERAHREAQSILRRAALDAELNKLSATEITDDALFAAAAACDLSPLFAARRAADLGLTAPPARADEARILARMAAR